MIYLKIENKDKSIKGVFSIFCDEIVRTSKINTKIIFFNSLFPGLSLLQTKIFHYFWDINQELS